MAPGGLTCACGAPVRDGVGCEDVYHEILAAEQQDPTLARWHTVVVCAYLLQHPAQGYAAFLDGQFRMLLLYRDRGLDTLLRVAAHQRARNRHGVRAGYDMDPLEPYTPLPARTPQARFSQGFLDLSDLVGDFGRDAYREYARRLDGIVAATIDAWLTGNVAERRGKW